MRRQMALVAGALVLAGCVNACSSGSGSTPVANITCKSFLAESTQARTVSFDQASNQVGNTAKDPGNLESVVQACDFSPAQTLGVTIQKVTGSKPTSSSTVRPGTTLPSVQIAPTALTGGQLPHETVGDPIAVILSNLMGILDEATCTKNAGLIAHVFADQRLLQEFEGVISKGKVGCFHSAVHELAVKGQSGGQFLATFGGPQFVNGTYVLAWNGSEWLLSIPPKG